MFLSNMEYHMHFWYYCPAPAPVL